MQEISNSVIPTMTSLELVKIINEMRDIGKPILAHTDFMTRIERVSKETGISFKTDTYQHQQNKQFYPCALLCARLSKLMVMTESVKVQLAVLDRVTELENKPLTIIDYARALVTAHDENERLLLENQGLKDEIVEIKDDGKMMATLYEINLANKSEDRNSHQWAVSRALNKLRGR